MAVELCRLCVQLPRSGLHLRPAAAAQLGQVGQLLLFAVQVAQHMVGQHLAAAQQTGLLLLPFLARVAQLRGMPIEPLLRVRAAPLQCVAHMAVQAAHFVQLLRTVRAGQLGGGGGRGCAHVGGEIREREIGFVPHPAHHRNRRGRHRTHRRFFVKRPQILNAAPAAAHNQHIRLRVFCRCCNGRGYLKLAARALHRRGIHHHAHIRRPPP